MSARAGHPANWNRQAVWNSTAGIRQDRRWRRGELVTDRTGLVDSTAKIRQDSKGGTESSGALEQLSWEQTGHEEWNKKTGNREDRRCGTLYLQII